MSNSRGEICDPLLNAAHGFGLSGYDINVELHPGKWVEVRFTADRVGEFQFFCTVYCSPEHGLMRGKLIVVSSG